MRIDKNGERRKGEREREREKEKEKYYVVIMLKESDDNGFSLAPQM
jgi:hypothetical protein